VPQRSAIVVGGGIGGLATAIALSGRGWRVQVFERAPDLTEVGAGISLWSNALRALDLIAGGLGEQVQALGDAEVTGGIQHRTGRWLTRADAAEVTRRYGPVIMMHRADLLAALLDRVPPEALVAGAEVTGVQVTGVAARGDAVTVTHSGGQASADLVIGADGLRSTVRRLVWPDAPAPRYAGYTAWRWVAPPLPDARDGGGETWGTGTRFGHATLPDHRVYCYATANTPAGATSPAGEAAELRSRFGDWHDPIPALVDAAAGTQVLRHDLYELPDLPSFARGRVALLGDAAHAMTPNLGQGACQALEDAATLGAVLAEEPDVAGALSRYDRLRRPRTQDIVKRSRQMGAVGQWSWPPAVVVRDRLLPLVPSSIALRMLAQVLAWPPAGGITRELRPA
jgi:2-polyprenyl-6-methoxyphenol hydroxylase-like FAD-dependent oxidoreductase